MSETTSRTMVQNQGTCQAFTSFLEFQSERWEITQHSIESFHEQQVQHWQHYESPETEDLEVMDKCLEEQWQVDTPTFTCAFGESFCISPISSLDGGVNMIDEAFALETEVGRLLKANGLERFAAAFSGAGVHTLEEASELSRFKMKSIVNCTFEERLQLQKLFNCFHRNTDLGMELIKMGLSQYTKAFYHAAVINLEQLLNVEDLEELGVRDWQHQEKILKLLSSTS